jgi:hypothetical protein
MAAVPLVAVAVPAVALALGLVPVPVLGLWGRKMKHFCLGPLVQHRAGQQQVGLQLGWTTTLGRPGLQLR